MIIDKKGKKRKSSLSEESWNEKTPSTSTPAVQKSPLSKEEKNETPSVLAKPQPLLDLTKVKSAVKAVLKLIEDHASKGTSLFADEACPIHMQVTCIKVAKTPERCIRVVLPHSLVTDTSDVCLIVPDQKKGKKEDHEPTIVHYQELLEKNEVTGITQVIPLRQLKVEYDQYELKRRLCDQFEFFLTDGKITGHVRHQLGLCFLKKRKYPTPIRLDSKNLKSEIAKGLSKTTMTVHGKGNCSTARVGHSKQSVEEIAENIMAVAEGLAQEYPGGWANIRSLSIKGEKSLCVPLYLTLKSSNTMDVPRVTPKRPKAFVPVEDELSTFPGARVTVLPSGKVIVTRDENEDVDSDIELNEILEEFKTIPKSEKKKQKKNKKNGKLGKTTSRPLLNPSSIKRTAEEDILSGGEESEGEMDILHSDQIKKKDLLNVPTKLQQKPKKKKKVDLEEHDKDIEEAESAYLSEKFQEQESSFLDIRKKDSLKASTKKHQKPKKKKQVDLDENDDEDIKEAESAYLSEIFQEHESSFLEESMEKSADNLPYQKERKQKLFKKVGKAHKKQKHSKSDGEIKSKSFMKMKKKNNIDVALKLKKKKKNKNKSKQS